MADRNDAHAAAAAGLPHGPRHAAQHAGYDGNEFRRADTSRCHAHAGRLIKTILMSKSFFYPVQHLTDPGCLHCPLSLEEVY